MSQDPPGGSDHLPPGWRAAVEARKRARLEFFLEHGEWISEQVMYDELEEGDRAGLHENGIEVSREHAALLRPTSWKECFGVVSKAERNREKQLPQRHGQAPVRR